MEQGYKLKSSSTRLSSRDRLLRKPSSSVSSRAGIVAPTVGFFRRREVIKKEKRLTRMKSDSHACASFLVGVIKPALVNAYVMIIRYLVAIACVYK